MEVLLAGNTGYVTETFIEESFPECDVVVLGNEMLKSNRKKNILSRPFIKDEKELKEIFETYEFERIVYFSNYLTMHGRMTGELEQLRQILQLCKKNKEVVSTTLSKHRKCSYGIWKYVSDKHQDSENSSFIFSGIHTGLFL